MGQVQNKVAIVTGGASGIGAECAVTLAREGAKSGENWGAYLRDCPIDARYEHGYRSGLALCLK